MPVSSDRFPTRTAGPYEPPGLAAFGRDADGLRDGVLREFAKIAEAMRGYPAISLNQIPCLWVPGSLLTLATAGTAPAVGVRGVHPAAVYGDAVDRTGTVNFRVLFRGKYRLYLVNSTDAPGGGIVRWTCTYSVLGSEGGDSTTFSTAAGVKDASVTIDGPVTNRVRWSPLADLFLDSPCEVGLAVRRNAGSAPDTGASAAYVIGVGLERIEENA